MPKRSSDNTDILRVIKDNAVVVFNADVVLSTGVVLTAKRVSSTLFTDLTRRYKRPRPPVVVNSDLGRSEPNPDDPDFKQDLMEYETDLGMSMIDLMIMMGTDLKSIPDGFPKVTDESWSRKLNIIGYNISKDDPDIRYLQWVKYIAAGADSDIPAISEAVARVSGVSEKDAADAASRFRDKSRRS